MKKIISLLLAMVMFTLSPAVLGIGSESAAFASEDETVIFSDNFNKHENTVTHQTSPDGIGQVLVDGTATARNAYSLGGITLYTTNRSDDSSYFKSQSKDTDSSDKYIETTISRFSNNSRGAYIGFDAVNAESGKDVVLSFDMKETNEGGTSYDEAFSIGGTIVDLKTAGLNDGNWHKYKVVVTTLGTSVYVDENESAIAVSSDTSADDITFNGLINGEIAADAQKSSSTPIGYVTFGIDNLVIYTSADGAASVPPTAEDNNATLEPDETFEPTASPNPDESFEPTASPNPDESFEPTASPNPDESFEPTASPNPDESFEPTASPNPDETFEPTASPNPTETPKLTFKYNSDSITDTHKVYDVYLSGINEFYNLTMEIFNPAGQYEFSLSNVMEGISSTNNYYEDCGLQYIQISSQSYISISSNTKIASIDVDLPESPSSDFILSASYISINNSFDFDDIQTDGITKQPIKYMSNVATISDNSGNPAKGTIIGYVPGNTVFSKLIWNVLYLNDKEEWKEKLASVELPEITGDIYVSAGIILTAASSNTLNNTYINAFLQ